MNWKVGMKAVRVSRGGNLRVPLLIPIGAVREVDGVSACRCGTKLRFKGVGNSPGKSGTHCGTCGYRWPNDKWFTSEYFRPLLETDVHCELLADLGHRLVEEKPEVVREPQKA